MNLFYQLKKLIKKEYFFNIETQKNFYTGTTVYVFYVFEEIKEYNFKGLIISKNFTNNNKKICVKRFIDGISFQHIINLNSPLIKLITFSKKKEKKNVKKSKLYYTRYLNENMLDLLLKSK